MLTLPSASTAPQSLAGDLASALDPVVFAIQAGIEPEPWQATFLRSSERERILLCSRQAGKSTITAALAMHQALYHAGSLILLVAPAKRQSEELYKKVKALYIGAGEPMTTESSTKFEMELTNGSRIVTIPDKEGTVRGYSDVALAIIDEAAWVSNDTYQTLRPMLAVSQGYLILLSTPHGKRGFFYHEWTSGGEGWHRTKITAYESSLISKDWLEGERLKIPANVFNQEYLCMFEDADTQAFATADIERSQIRESVEEWTWLPRMTPR